MHPLAKLFSFHRTALILLLSLFVPGVCFSAKTSDEEFRPVTLIKKAFPAIKNVRVYPADGVLVDDDELVLGVEINGKSRAYPINMLKGPRREIVNDHLGGTDIAATW